MLPDRFILTCALALGYGANMVPDWFDYVFTYSGPNHALQGFYDAIELVMQTGFAISAFVAIFLNLFLHDEIEEEVVITNEHFPSSPPLEERASFAAGQRKNEASESTAMADPEKLRVQ